VTLLYQAQHYEPPLIAFLQDLVRIPSVNGRNSEAAVAARIQHEAQALGFDVLIVASDPARPNVLVTWGKGDNAFALIGHTDTVAEGDPAAWIHPPFEAVIANGKLIGRGSADNKAGIACGLYAMALLRDQAMLDPTQARIIQAGVVDEESGASSPLGVRHLIDTGQLSAKGAIYTYAGDIICTGHRGLLRLIARVEGKSIHSGSSEWSRGEGGANAIAGLAAFLARLDGLRIEGPYSEEFASMGTTITPTLMRGGEFESMVPAHAEALIDIRMVPGQDADAVIAIIQGLLDSELKQHSGLRGGIEVKNRLPGAAIPREHRLAQIALAQAGALSSRALDLGVAGPANEGYMLIGAGIPTLPGFGAEGGNAHAPDEWVSIDSLVETIAIYAGVIRDYLS
jgi:acetylornithine deacetylase/succinyl-diaminopimelate desuccinylase-like protein